MTSWDFCPHPECRERDLHGHGTDQKYLPNLPSEESAMAEKNPYVQGPPLRRGRCSETRHHAPHIERDEGPEFLCDIEPHVSITKAELPPLKPVRDHRGFGFTFWEEIPWKEGCTTCDEIRVDPQQRVGPVIDHWAVVGIPLEPTKQREGDQRLPDGDESQPDDFTAYIDDIAARRAVGIERYGQAHRPFNGRDTLTDAYEEVLDTGLYLRSLLTQAKADREELVRVVTLALESLGIQGDYEKSGAELAAEVAVDRIMGWVVAQREEILSLMADSE